MSVPSNVLPFPLQLDSRYDKNSIRNKSYPKQQNYYEFKRTQRQRRTPKMSQEHTLARSYSRYQPYSTNAQPLAPMHVFNAYESVDPYSYPSIRHNPEIKKIIDGFQMTLGNHPVYMGNNDIIVLQFDGNQTLREKYSTYMEEVNQFCDKIEIFASLPQNEKRLNLKKGWLDVLMLRSCWWYANAPPDETMQVIRVNGKYGLQRDHNKQLEPLFAFAQTMNDMALNEIELSLVIVYSLLLGTFSFIRNPQTKEMSATAHRRDYVLKLLSDYQLEVYPEDDLRFVKLLSNLSELTYISGMA